MMETVLISGGTGLIGTALTDALLKKGYQVVILTRTPPPGKKTGVQYSRWHPPSGALDAKAIEKADYIVHLAGSNVGEGRWTPKRKQEIIDSRVKTGSLITGALQRIPNRVKAVISSSGIGYYGPDPDQENKGFTEKSPPATDFLASTVRDWESSILNAAERTRVVIFRTGMVLSAHGGALKEFLRPLKFRIGTVLGRGEQVVSWIHIEDLVRLYLEAIENQTMEGIYNAVAPNPVTNREFTRQLAAVHGRHITVRVPAFILRTLFGEMSIEVLKSTTASPARLAEHGFLFIFPTIDSAFRNIIR